MIRKVRFSAVAGFCATLGFAAASLSGVAAQEAAPAAPDAAPAAPAAQGATPPAAAAPEPTREAIGDWTKLCAPAGKPCVIEQVGKTAQGESALVMKIERLPKPEKRGKETVESVAQILTPLNVLLPNGLRLQIDDGDVQTSGYLLCQANGCVVSAAMQAGLVSAFKRGAVANFAYTIVQGDKPREVKSAVSLSGFTKAFDALQ